MASREESVSDSLASARLEHAEPSVEARALAQTWATGDAEDSDLDRFIKQRLENAQRSAQASRGPAAA